MRPSSLEDEKKNKDAAEQRQRSSLDLNQVNENDRNNQSNLLYQALFLPDGTSHSRGSKGNYASSVNNSLINTGFVSPYAKGTPVFVNNADRWKSTRSLSSSTESIAATSKGSSSWSNDSLKWTSSSNSQASSSKSYLPHCSSTETVGSFINEVDGQNKEHQCEERHHGFNGRSSNVPYNDVLGASASGNAFQIINNQCYEAAITEGMKGFPSDKYTAKMKHSKRLTVGSVDGPSQMRQPQTCNHRHHHQHNRTEKKSEVTKTKCSSGFLAPSAPHPFLRTKAESPKPSPSDIAGHKKFRYNQTFSALQQSGLMKTTMKTAELLRRSRSLQQELAKLRRDTALFVECVLNNPQNRHLKEQCERNQNSGGSKTAFESLASNHIT